MGREHEVLGEFVLKLGEVFKKKNPPQTSHSYANTDARPPTPKRSKVKDLMFYGGLIGFVLFSGWIILNMDRLTMPTVTFTRGGETLSVRGNCSWVHDEWTRERNRILGFTPAYEFDEPNFTWREGTYEMNFSNTTTSTLPCPICLDCEPAVCPDCICNCPQPVCDPCAECVCDCAEVDDALYVINKARPTAESVAYQGGWFDMRKVCQSALGGTTSKFKEAPRYTLSQIYSGLTPPSGSKVCFHDLSSKQDGTVFEINNSAWHITGEGSVKRVYRVYYVENESGLYVS